MRKLYSDLIVSCQKGNYGDLYDFNKETIESLIEPVGEFISALKN